jgi:PPOX class probable F420-dependent enzyme
MTKIPETHRDLLDSQCATLATISPDGRPQLTEVWFLDDGDSVAISLAASRQKTKNLTRNPHCSVFILDLGNPYRYLELRGDAEIEPDADYAFATRVGAKYDADLREYDQPGEKRVVARIRPARVNAVDMSGL